MRLYETTFIVRQDVASTDADALGEHFGGLIKELGGKVLKTENWGLRSLAYKVQKNKKGHYIMFNYEADNKTVAELERRFRLHEDVLRYLTLQIESFSKEPSVMMRKEDDDRQAA